jgi:hypothetical protein
MPIMGWYDGSVFQQEEQLGALGDLPELGSRKKEVPANKKRSRSPPLCRAALVGRNKKRGRERSFDEAQTDAQ